MLEDIASGGSGENETNFKYIELGGQKRGQHRFRHWFMPQRTLYAAILFLVGLVVTGTPGHGTAQSLPGLPPCPDPPPKTQTIPPIPDSTRPPIIDPSILVPGGGIPCDASHLGVRSNPPEAPPPAPPMIGPCTEECQRMMDDRKKELEKQGIKIN